jgi:hypothetical protein
MLPTFYWTTFDVSGMLPPRWRQDVLAAASEADFRDFPRRPVGPINGPHSSGCTGGRFGILP